jgi:hypothetical protein
MFVEQLPENEEAVRTCRVLRSQLQEMLQDMFKALGSADNAR